MFPKIDPSQMAGMMKKLGIQNEKINAKKVIIETSDSNIVIENPQVMCIKMQGTKTYQISGDEHQESSSETEKFSEEDVKIVAEKTGKSEEEARIALQNSDGDIAEAIVSLS